MGKRLEKWVDMKRGSEGGFQRREDKLGDD